MLLFYWWFTYSSQAGNVHVYYTVLVTYPNKVCICIDYFFYCFFLGWPIPWSCPSRWLNVICGHRAPSPSYQKQLVWTSSMWRPKWWWGSLWTKPICPHWRNPSFLSTLSALRWEVLSCSIKRTAGIDFFHECVWYSLSFFKNLSKLTYKSILIALVSIWGQLMSIINCNNQETGVARSEVYSLKVVLLHNAARGINKILNTQHTSCLMAWLYHCRKLLMEIFQLWFVHLVHTVCLLSSFSNQRAKRSNHKVIRTHMLWSRFLRLITNSGS